MLMTKQKVLHSNEELGPEHAEHSSADPRVSGERRDKASMQQSIAPVHAVVRPLAHAPHG